MDGYYIGEICSNGRIGVNKDKTGNKREPLDISIKGEAYKKREDASSLVLYANVSDFGVNDISSASTSN